MSVWGWAGAVLVGAGAFCATPGLQSQMVQPVIMEYKGDASGRLELTNNTGEPLAVVLEPKSFSVSEEGRGAFRALDETIHVELSSMSMKLQPKETYHVFYKASAEQLPAWFTIYATFSPVHHGQDIAVRIQLPHTVYLYQKRPLQQDEVVVESAVYSAQSHKLVCVLHNVGRSLGRGQSVHVSGPHGDAVDQPGFPLLPGMTRRLEVDWKEAAAPTSLQVVFEHFTLKPAITTAPSGSGGAKSDGAAPVRSER